MGVGDTWAAFIETADPCDIRGTQVPSLADVDTWGPQRCDGRLSAPAEGKPGTQGWGKAGSLGLEGQGRAGDGGAEKGRSPPIVQHRRVVIGCQHVAAPRFEEVDFEAFKKNAIWRCIKINQQAGKWGFITHLS